MTNDRPTYRLHVETDALPVYAINIATETAGAYRGASEAGALGTEIVTDDPAEAQAIRDALRDRGFRAQITDNN